MIRPMLRQAGRTRRQAYLPGSRQARLPRQREVLRSHPSGRRAWHRLTSSRQRWRVARRPETRLTVQVISRLTRQVERTRRQVRSPRSPQSLRLRPSAHRAWRPLKISRRRQKAAPRPNARRIVQVMSLALQRAERARWQARSPRRREPLRSRPNRLRARHLPEISRRRRKALPRPNARRTVPGILPLLRRTERLVLLLPRRTGRALRVLPREAQRVSPLGRHPASIWPESSFRRSRRPMPSSSRCRRILPPPSLRPPSVPRFRPAPSATLPRQGRTHALRKAKPCRPRGRRRRAGQTDLARRPSRSAAAATLFLRRHHLKSATA